MPTLLIE